jgi:putative tricarboxylic transport membrane protein
VSAGAPAASPERRLDAAALVIALLLVALAGVVAWDAAHMRTGVAAYSRIGPRAFPYGIAIGLAVLGLITAIQAFRAPDAPPPRDRIVPIAWIVGGLVGQIALIPYAGFSVATGAVFAATAKAFGRGPLWVTYPVGVGFALSIWLFFSKALQLVLPAGPLEKLF